MGRALLALLILGLSSACGGPGPVRWASDPTDPQSYDQALAAWTRHGESYEDLEGRLFVDATLISPAFALAHARDEGERAGLSEAERTALQQQRVAEADKTLRFYVAVVTNDRTWNDLHTRRPTFRPRLWVGDTPVEPQSVKRLDAAARRQTSTWFPYATPMADVYWMTFPKPDRVDALTLRIAGGLGRVALKWELQ